MRRMVLLWMLAGGLQAQMPPCPEGTRALSDSSYWIGWGADIGNTRMRPGLAAPVAAAWTVPASASLAPSLVGGKPFPAGGSGTLHAIDAHTGCSFWGYRSDAKPAGSVLVGAVRPGRFAVFFADSAANLHTLDFEIGRLAWKIRLSGEPAAPALLFNETLFVPPAGEIEAIAGATGASLWKRAADTRHALAAGLRANRIIVASEANQALALDPATGKHLWSASLPASPSAAPMFIREHDALLVGCADGTLLALRATDGSRLWAAKLEGA